MKKPLVLVGALLVQTIAQAHPGHHHAVGLPDLHSLFSWDQLVWAAVLAIVIAVYIRSR
jgi:hypothetical protein